MNDETETREKDGDVNRDGDRDGVVDRRDCEACFEAGIKLGALYHQFTGTPISETSSESLETAIEEAVENQIYVDEVGIEIDDIETNRFGYSELEGEMLDVDLVVEKDGVVVEASMSEEDGYPMMRVDKVTNRGDR